MVNNSKLSWDHMENTWKYLLPPSTKKRHQIVNFRYKKSQT